MRRLIVGFLLFLVVFAVPPMWVRGAAPTTEQEGTETMKRIATDTDKARAAAEAVARAILKTPVEVPVPPSVSLRCHHDTEAKDETVLKAFQEEFDKPEGPALGALLEQRRKAQLLGYDSDEGYALEQRLAQRLLKKASMLIDRYTGQEDSYIPVTRVATKAEKEFMLLAGPDGSDASLLPRIAVWAKKLADMFLDELVNKHEYRNLHPVGKLAKDASLLGADMGPYMERLRNALSFKLEYEYKINPGKDYGYDTEVRAEVPVSLLDGTGMAAGTGKYSHIRVNDDKMIVQVAGMPIPFGVVMGIAGFLPCKSDTFNVFVDRFGAANEILTFVSTVSDIPPKTVNTGGYAHVLGIQAFQSMKVKEAYSFPVTVRNGQEVAAEQTFTNTVRIFDVELKLKLTHTPKG